MKTLLIKNGRLIDPANNVDKVSDLLVVDGKVAGSNIKVTESTEIIDVSGKIVVPGLIDIHVHLREPGRGDKETIETGTQCAARGGFTSIVCMPNTTPTADNSGTIALIRQRAQEVSPVNVYTTGAITKDIKGEELTSIGSLQSAGVVAITDDGHCIQNNELMRRAVEYAKMFELPVMDHCQDYRLVGNGVINEGYWSTVLGLQGWPAIGETVIVARNILLSELTGWKIHCQHISSEQSIRLIREAKTRGVMISAEACPHHFTLTDEVLKTYDTNCKMNPPLRSERDREAIWEGLADGTIDCIGSDHAPHATYEKQVEFDLAPFGIIGLETELALSIKLVQEKVLTWPQLIEKFTQNPDKLLKLNKGNLAPGMDADITIIDPDLEWTYNVEQSASKSRNSPFHGWNFRGKSVKTIVDGKIVWNER